MAGTFGPGTITQSWIEDAELISYSENDYNNARYDLNDEWGGIAESTYKASGIKECTATFAMPCGADFGTITLGSGGLSEISISTSNGDWPQVSIKWYSGLPTCQSGETFSVSLPTLQMKRVAQALGFTVGTSSYVQSGTWTATASLQLLLGEEATPVAYAMDGAQITAQCTVIGTATAATGYTLTNTSKATSNTTYQEMSYTAEKVLTGTPPTTSAS